MTVISAMKFNDFEGAMVADEQSSGGGRKYDLAEKIHEFSCPTSKLIVGGSGTADLLYDSILQFTQTFPEKQDKVQNADNFVQFLAHIFTQVTHSHVDGILRSRSGHSWLEFQQGYIITENGKEPMGERLQAEYEKLKNELWSPESFLNSSFLALASDVSGIEIYSVSLGSTKPMPVARPYAVIGSGSDMADRELMGFFQPMTREERKNITPVEGIKALLQATYQASTGNIGVGGSPNIYLLNAEGKISNPSENSSILANEIVKGNHKGFLSNEYTSAALDNLLFKGQDFKIAEKSMWDAVKDKTAFGLMLRNYKKY